MIRNKRAMAKSQVQHNSRAALIITGMLIATGLLAGTTVACTSTTTQTTAGQSTGSAVFSANCVSCHGAQRQGGVGPALTMTALIERGRTGEFIRETINTGRGGMPSWKDKLSEEEIEALIVFLLP